MEQQDRRKAPRRRTPLEVRFEARFDGKPPTQEQMEAIIAALESVPSPTQQ